jgi:hypothetical protein
MTAYEAFFIGLGIGLSWLFACFLVVLWFQRVKALEEQFADETGTEAVSFQG